MTPQVLLIEDDDAMRMSLAQTLDLEGIKVISVTSFAQARRAIRANFAGVILSDIRMPVDDGFIVLAHVQSVDPELPVIFLTGEADVPMALRAIRDGAYDFLEKPCPSDQLLSVLDRAIRYRDVVLQKRRLESKIIRNDPATTNFPGVCKASKSLQNNLRRLGGTTDHVYISGASGVGKKLAGFTLHSLGAEDAKFVGFNLLNQDKKLTDLVLPDGIVNLSIKSADRATQDDYDWMTQAIERNPHLRLLISGQRTLSQNKELYDFYNRISISDITIPTLMARRKDLPIIFEQTLRYSVRNLNMDMPDVPQEVYTDIMSRDWDGNLTELRAFAQRYLDQQTNGHSNPETLTLAQQLDNYEALILTEGLKRTKGNATQTAQHLGMPRKTFYDRLARYDIRPKEFK